MVVRSFEHIVSTFGFTFIDLNYSSLLQIEILVLQNQYTQRLNNKLLLHVLIVVILIYYFSDGVIL